MFSQPVVELVYNGDTLAPVLFAKALAAGELDGWYATAPIFLIPDYATYLFFHFLFAGDVAWAMIATAYVFAALAVTGWIYFFRTVFNNRPQINRAVLITAAAVYLFSSMEPLYAVNKSVLPCWHGGAFVLLPYCLGWFWRFVHDNTPLSLPAALLIAAGTASDPIFILWFYAPCGIYLLFTGNRRKLLLGGAFFSACAAAAFALRYFISEFVYADIISTSNSFTFFPLWLETFLYFFVDSLGNYVTFRLDHSLFDNFIAHVANIWQQSPVISVFWGLSLAVLCLGGTFSVAGKPARLLLLVAFFGGFAPVLVGYQLTENYLLPFWLTPVFTAFPFSAGVLWRQYMSVSTRWRFGIGALAIAILATPYPYATPFNYYPADYACLDEKIKEHNVQAGLSTFWLARRFELLSKNNIKIFTTSYTLHPSLWLNNVHYANGDSYNLVLNDTRDLGMPIYRITKEDADALVNVDSIAEFSCGPYEGWVYPTFSYVNKVCAESNLSRKWHSILKNSSHIYFSGHEQAREVCASFFPNAYTNDAPP